MCDLHDSLMAENEQLTNEMSGLLHTTRKLGREIVGLRNRLRQQDIDDPANANVLMLLQSWVRLTGRTKQSNIQPGSDRWDMARKAIKREGSGQGGEPTGVKRCILAVEGIALRPYGPAYNRQATGKPSDRLDDLEYALSTSKRVDDAIRIRATVLGASADDLFDAVSQIRATEHLYSLALTAATNREWFQSLSDEEKAKRRVSTWQQLVEYGLDETEPARDFYAQHADVIDLAARRKERAA